MRSEEIRDPKTVKRFEGDQEPESQITTGGMKTMKDCRRTGSRKWKARKQ